MYTLMGATGNIGGRAASNLLSEGKKVRVIGRSGKKLEELVSKGAEPAIGDALDTDFLSKAFSGSEAVFVMIPPNYEAEDFFQFQYDVSRSTVNAISVSGVKKVVFLSSVGAELPDNNGPIKGLHSAEKMLNDLSDVDVMHLRAAFFMENLFTYIPIIKSKGINGGPYKKDAKIAMVATKDIGDVVSRMLINSTFTGKNVNYLLGERDVSFGEFTHIFGSKIGMADLQYIETSYDDAKNGMLQTGMREDHADIFIEMIRSLNDGLIKPLEERNESNTTETSIEEFSEMLVGIYNSPDQKFVYN